MDINKSRQEFIDRIALRSAVNAATQTRSKKFHVFAESITIKTSDTTEETKRKRTEKIEVIQFWKTKLKEYAVKYEEKRDDEFFIKDVVAFQKEFEAFNNKFEGEGIRIAQCQKSLSVYLKWLWCLGHLNNEPPMCPIDRNVLNACYKNLDKKADKEERKLIQKVNRDGGWGQINDLDEYKGLVNIVKKVAGTQSPAVWELSLFNVILQEEKDESDS